MPAMPPFQSDFAAWREEILVAAGFLTRLPVHPAQPPTDGALARAGWAFPLIGIAIGLIGWFPYRVAEALGLPAMAAALLAVSATVLLTGGLHEDGLADTADGLGGGATREAKLAIMHDSRSGAFGVLALIFSVGLRAVALAAVADGGALGALVAAHALARGALPMALWMLDPARSDGLGAEAGRPTRAVALGAAGIGVAVSLVALGGGLGFIAVLFAAAGMISIALVARRALGGYTGDVLGAIEQGGETIMLLAASTWLV